MRLLKLKPKEPEFQLYESLEDLPLYNWSKMQEKNDINWLRIDFDGRQKKIENKESLLKLEELKKRLEDEFFLIWDDDKFKETLQKRHEIKYYIGLYEVVDATLNRIEAGYVNQQMESRLISIRKLKQLRYIMPELNSVEGDRIEIKRLRQQNDGIKTKIQLLAGDIETEGKKVTRRLNTELAGVSKTLELGYAIDAKTITVADWIDLQKQAIEINEKNKRSQTNE